MYQGWKYDGIKVEMVRKCTFRMELYSIEGNDLYISHHKNHYIAADTNGLTPDSRLQKLRIFNLTTFPGVKNLDNSIPDATSEPIFIPNGVIFGSEIATSVYVSQPHAVRLIYIIIPIIIYTNLTLIL